MSRRPTVPRPVAFWLVAATFTVTMLGTTLPTPLYVLYQQKLGFSSLMVTIIFALYAVGVLVGLVLFGRASDQLGRRWVLIPALICAALAATAFLIANGLALLFVGRLLSGLSAGIFTGTATAALLDLGGEGQDERATLGASAFAMIGLGLGPLLAGVLAELAPAPLRLPFWVNLGLVLLGMVAVWVTPETVEVPEHPRFSISRPDLPAEVRAAFIPAATAGFAAFAVLGLFTSVAPSFLADLLHHHSHALSGAIVFAVCIASAVAQVLAGRLGRAALPAGCAVLIAGMGVLAAGLGTRSLALLIAGGLIAGTGHGLAFRAGLGAINAEAPEDRRAGAASSFFIVCYVALSLPVVGEGIAVTRLGLQTAGIVFSIAVAIVASIALGALLPRTRALRRAAA